MCAKSEAGLAVLTVLLCSLLLQVIMLYHLITYKLQMTVNSVQEGRGYCLGVSWLETRGAVALGEGRQQL